MSRIDIEVFGDDNELGIDIDITGYQNSVSTTIGKQNLPHLGEVINNWMSYRFRPLYDRMPIESLDIHCSEPLLDTFNPHVTNAIVLLGNTNSFISQNPHLEKIAESFENILFFNCGDDLRYKSFYNYLQKFVPIIYQNMDLGFNRIKRKWETAAPPMHVEELINYLVENKIKKIFTINHYLIDRYVAAFGIYLIPICKFMGIEFINIDHDPPDLRPGGYLHKAWQVGSQKFTCKSILQKYWDNFYEINCHYVAVPQDYSDVKFRKLNKNYDIVVLTNSRWDDVSSFKEQIDWLFDRLLDLRSFHLWYLAMRQIILEKDITEFEKLYCNSSLHSLMYMGRNYYKYLVLKKLNTKRKVTVYGDEGWLNVCPEIYGGSLNNEQIQKLNAENNHLYLLINPSYSYLDASGPLYDMIQRGLPFVNVSPVFKSDTFNGMQHIEYNGDMEILDNYKPPDPEIYRSILEASTEDIALILNDKQPNNIFSKHLVEHEKIIDKEINEYRLLNDSFLNLCYKRFFVN